MCGEKEICMGVFGNWSFLFLHFCYSKEVVGYIDCGYKYKSLGWLGAHTDFLNYTHKRF